MNRNPALTRKIILIIAGVLLLGIVYVSKVTFETVGAMALTVRDVFFTSEEKSAPKEPVVLSSFATRFRGVLMTMDHGKPEDFAVEKLAGVKYFALYFATSGQEASQAFTPDLTTFYRSFKPSHPEFELIFVSRDGSDREMQEGMRSAWMRWPAIWYADVDNPALDVKKYCGPQLPSLVLVDAQGKILSDNFDNGQFADPHRVLDDIRAVMK